MVGSDHDTIWPGTERVVTTPAYEALNAFDARYGTEPVRTTAARIALKYGYNRNHPLVDDIHNAIENAMELGRLRGPLEEAARRSDRTSA